MAVEGNTRRHPVIPFPIPANFAYDPMLEIPNVKAFVRTFNRDKNHWNELLEATLCYGIHCLSMNYNLQGLSLDDIKQLVKDNCKNPRDYFKRRSNTACKKSADRSQIPLWRAKPPSNWRDGESKHVFTEAVPCEKHEDSQPVPATKTTPGKQEIDFYRRAMGDEFVDYAWKAFLETGYPSRPPQLENILTSFKKMSINKQAWSSLLPVPVEEKSGISFSQFLRGFIIHELTLGSTPAQKQYRTPVEVPFPRVTNDECSSEHSDSSSSESILSEKQATRAAHIKPMKKINPRIIEKKVKDNSKTTRKTKPSASKNKDGTTEGIPRYLRHVESKIKQHLDADRNKILRVKKNQNQILREVLAKERMKEFEKGPQQRKKYSTSLGAHPGATALEIAERFSKGPFMDKFMKENDPYEAEILRNDFKNSSAADYDKMEVYGARMMDPDRSVGCPELNINLQSSKASQNSDSKRHGYTGWLGEFGADHTRAVQHGEWNSDEEEDFISKRKDVLRKTHEWDFDAIEKEAEKELHAKYPVEPMEWRGDIDEESKEDVHVAISGSSSVDEEQERNSVGSTDPAFEWLKLEEN